MFQLVPALQTAPRNLAGRLKGGARGGKSRGSARLRSGLVVAQVALSLVLLVGAGLLVRSFATLLAVDAGFSPDNLLTAEIRLPPSEYEPEKQAQFFTTLVEQLEALPGVTGVAAINQLPVRNPGSNIYVYGARNPPEDPSVSRTAYTRIVLPAFFETIEIPLLADRLRGDWRCGRRTHERAGEHAAHEHVPAALSVAAANDEAGDSHRRRPGSHCSGSTQRHTYARSEHPRRQPGDHGFDHRQLGNRRPVTCGAPCE